MAAEGGKGSEARGNEEKKQKKEEGPGRKRVQRENESLPLSSSLVSVSSQTGKKKRTVALDCPEHARGVDLEAHGAAVAGAAVGGRRRGRG